MRMQLANVLRWLARKIEPKKKPNIRNIETPFGTFQVILPQGMEPGNPNPFFKGEKPEWMKSSSEEMPFGFQQEGGKLQRIAEMFLEPLGDSDKEASYEWLKEITGSEELAEANLLLLSLLDKRRTMAQVCNPKPGSSPSSWKVWIEGEVEKGVVHVHGEISFRGERLFSLCRDMKQSGFDNGLPQELFYKHFVRYCLKGREQALSPFVEWQKLATVNSHLRQ